MSKDLIIFGNGIGRALSNETFDLGCAMSHVWEKSSCLTDETRRLISACLPDEANVPKGEHHLGLLQEAVVYCKNMKAIEGKTSEQFLTEDSRNLPGAVKGYFTEVASYFCDYCTDFDEDYNTFIDKLSAHLKETKSHVATLNYDTLLYSAFLDRKVMDVRSKTSLVDGFRNGSFNETNLRSRSDNAFGWYLHLHGSPLFSKNNQNKKIEKLKRSEWSKLLGGDLCFQSDHIVLTHIDHKEMIISNSPLLRKYWDYLIKAIHQAERIVLFGYSGADTHLNQKIRDTAEDKKQICIVERRAEKQESNRQKFWLDKLGKKNLNIALPDNILEFTSWADWGQ